MYPFILTFQSIIKAKLISLLLLSVIVAVVLILSVVFFATYISADLVSLDDSWLDQAFTWFAGLIFGVVGWFMLPAFVPLIAGMFQEKVIYKVHKHYYPNYLNQDDIKFWPDFIHDLKFTLKSLLLNLIILPLYLIGIGFVVSIILNSYLLGREFFESAAGYHMQKNKAQLFGNQNKAAVYGGGLVITGMTLTPVLNLFVPIIATVWMVHVYHSLKKP
ncbi:MAG: hypothetical protein DRQ51_08670 [Gammaproteobacteria bacterium]|nr:MAG: hypothetical protein DRQ51_08670 [Gammaproteobacteria bacterium]